MGTGNDVSLNGRIVQVLPAEDGMTVLIEGFTAPELFIIAASITRYANRMLDDETMANAITKRSRLVVPK